MTVLLTLLSILLPLSILNVILHSTGIYLLLRLYSKNKNKTQFVYLINLSLCELIINSVEAVETILRIINEVEYGPEKEKSPLSTVCYIMYIINATGFSFVFYMNMIYITLDRLFDILLNLRYPVYWDEYKAIALLKLTWVTGIAMIAITFVCCYGYDQWVWEAVMFEFFYPCLEIAFIVLAVFTYVFIFRKFKRSQLPPVHFENNGCISNGKPKKRNSTFEAFKKSRFYIAVLLILTFILFIIVPDLVYLFTIVLAERESEQILTICWLVYSIANISDAFIYIFLQAEVKALLVKKVRRLLGTEKQGTMTKTTYSYGTVKVKSECLLNGDGNETCL